MTISLQDFSKAAYSMGAWTTIRFKEGRLDQLATSWKDRFVVWIKDMGRRQDQIEQAKQDIIGAFLNALKREESDHPPIDRQVVGRHDFYKEIKCVKASIAREFASPPVKIGLGARAIRHLEDFTGGLKHVLSGDPFSPLAKRDAVTAPTPKFTPFVMGGGRANRRVFEDIDEEMAKSLNQSTRFPASEEHTPRSDPSKPS